MMKHREQIQDIDINRVQENQQMKETMEIEIEPQNRVYLILHKLV